MTGKAHRHARGSLIALLLDESLNGVRAIVRQLWRERKGEARSDRPHTIGSSKLLLGQASELVGDRAPDPRCQPIIHGVLSEALPDRIHGPVCARSRQTFPGAGAASIVGNADPGEPLLGGGPTPHIKATGSL
jgi:hypothetical protein